MSHWLVSSRGWRYSGKWRDAGIWRIGGACGSGRLEGVCRHGRWRVCRLLNGQVNLAVIAAPLVVSTFAVKIAGAIDMTSTVVNTKGLCAELL
jgi:hypothetical protein